MTYQSPIPALLPLVSGVQETPVAAIVVGQRHSPAHLVAAKRQLLKREIHAFLHPEEVTTAELVAAERRYHRIQMAQFDDRGPNGAPALDGVQQVLQRMDAYHRELNQRMDEIQAELYLGMDEIQAEQQALNQRMDEMQAELYLGMDEIQHELNLFDRRLMQETQRSKNRSIRRNKDRIEPVIRIDNGEVPLNFPRTMEDFWRATGPELNELLQFYNLDEPDDIEEKQALLCQHLGLGL